MEKTSNPKPKSHTLHITHYITHYTLHYTLHLIPKNYKQAIAPAKHGDKLTQSPEPI
jgi:hypothetical protein